MLYLNQLIVKANGTQRSDAEIIAHVINVALREYNIPLSIISQNDINAPDALNRAQTELRNYWKGNLEGRQGRQVNIRQKQRVPLHLQEVSSNLIKELLKRDMMVIGETPRTRAGRNSKVTAHNAVYKVTKQLLVELRNNNRLE
jgi:hypothetical protein